MFPTVLHLRRTRMYALVETLVRPNLAEKSVLILIGVLQQLANCFRFI
jgi:hypothetical protein